MWVGRRAPICIIGGQISLGANIWKVFWRKHLCRHTIQKQTSAASVRSECSSLGMASSPKYEQKNWYRERSRENTIDSNTMDYPSLLRLWWHSCQDCCQHQWNMLCTFWCTYIDNPKKLTSPRMLPRKMSLFRYVCHNYHVFGCDFFTYNLFCVQLHRTSTVRAARKHVRSVKCHSDDVRR